MLIEYEQKLIFEEESLVEKGNAREPLRQRRLITPAFSRRQDSPIADLIGKCLMEVSALSEPLTTNAKYAPTPVLIKKKAIQETISLQTF